MTDTAAFRVGPHRGEPATAVADAVALGANAVQIFLATPNGFDPPSLEDPAGLREQAEAADVAIYVHAPYRINVASTNNRLRVPSRKLLQAHLQGAAEIGARGVVVHPGYLKDEEDPAVGFDNWRKCVDGLDLPVPLLLENAAGGENAMARSAEQIASLWAAVGEAAGAENVGFCLDTCHAHAAGHDLATFAQTILDITGRIDLVHCNDSRDEFDSRRDRHANIGEGHVDLNGLSTLLRTAKAPAIVETATEGQAADITWVREAMSD